MRRSTTSVLFAVPFAFALAGCGSSSETCSQMAMCPVGSGSYKLCTTGASASCRYVASDGTSFACASCADCQAAAMKALAWCSGAGGDGGTGAGGCVTQTVCANSAKDCAAGQRCNTALNPPVCQALYCGAEGTPCAGDSANDLCASRMCTASVCSGVPDMAGAGNSCCQPGHMGNELGVGKYCTSQNDCAGQMANVCTIVSGQTTVGFCTMLCMAGTSCGSNATCMTGSGSTSGGCIPTNCSTTGCT